MALEKTKRAAEQQRHAGDQHRGENREIELGRGSIARGIGAMLLEFLRTVIVVVMRPRRRNRIIIRTGDDRHRPMLERRHESGWCQQSQREQDAQQRRK